MANDYYIRDRGKIQGPFSAEKLQMLAKRGRFGRHFEVSENGQHWSRATAYPELFPEPPKRKRRVPEPQVSSGPIATHEMFEGSAEFDDFQADPAVWFYGHDSQENGPVPLSTLRTLAKQGHLSPGDPVWTDGMSDWSPASQIAAIWSEESPFPGTAAGGPTAHARHPGNAAHSQAGGTEPLAITSLVLGILGMSFLPVLGSLLAVVFGHMALRDIRVSRGALTGRGLALAGLILGYAVVIAAIIAALAVVTWLFFERVLGAQ